jgi:nicotinamidase/pyrazinamidase
MTDHALILVDLQHDFLPGGALAVSGGTEVIPIANRLMKDFEIVVATQDWHPADHGSFAANHPGRSIYEIIDLNGLPQTLWPVHCVQNTAGAELAPGLEVGRITRVFQKGTHPEIDSYSSFFDNGHRSNTGLSEWLRGQGIRRLTICGLATDYCVKFTALDAISEGFEVTLDLTASRGVNLQPDDVANAIREMKGKGVKVAE